MAKALPLSTRGTTSFALKLSSAKSLIHFACKDSASASAGVFKRPPVTSPPTTNRYQDPPIDEGDLKLLQGLNLILDPIHIVAN